MILDLLTHYAQAFWHMTLEMAPYLLLGLFFAGILKVYVNQEWFKKHLGQNNLKSVIKASFIGVPLPLCSCGVIPTGISLFKNGASKASTVSFMISTPQTGVDSILATYGMLGLPLAVFRPLMALLNGMLGGSLLLNKNTKLKTANDNKIENTKTFTKPKPKGKYHILKVFDYALREFLTDIAGSLVVGLAIAALISVLIPETFFSEYQLPLLFMYGLVLICSIPMYVCATGSIPIAAALIMKGITPGAAMVFLLAGPATNAATISVIKNAMGKKTLWAYLSSIAIGALIFGLTVDLLFPESWIQMMPMTHGHSMHILPEWLHLASAIILIVAVAWVYLEQYKIIDFRKAKRKRNNQKEKPNSIKMEHKYQVEGMSCNHCKSSVENNVGALGEINKATVNLIKKELTVSGNTINDQTIIDTVTKLGFTIEKKS